jgi:hypothetical protein
MRPRPLLMGLLWLLWVNFDLDALVQCNLSCHISFCTDGARPRPYEIPRNALARSLSERFEITPP